MTNKKKSWFTLVKRFFISDSHSKQDKKEKRKKWVFARLRMKRQASLTAPPQPQPQQQQDIEKEEKEEERANVVSETEKKQRNLAVSASIASGEFEKGPEKLILVEAQAVKDVCSVIGNERDFLYISAMKIQTAFRGYLARQALRALKGIVTLQAIIRGRAVRRQAVTTLKRLQSIVNIQSQVCANRLQVQVQVQPTNPDSDYDYANDQLTDFRTKMLRMDSYSHRRWDDSLMSKEEADALFLSKKEAAIKRERIKEYWHQHRKSAESERKHVSGRWRYWLEQWVDTQLTKSKELEDLDTKQSFQRRDNDLGNVKSLNHRRRQSSLGDESSFPGSPALVVPTYMAATESARAKAKSVDGFSPSKNRLSLVSSIASEAAIIGGKGFEQRSPSLKGVRGPVKSRKVKDLSFDSDCSLSHWNHQQFSNAFRS